ncbi:hypothetical protein NDU88_007490 [Pleurodeles waltl]|uniref:Uncharacterized protein n=1 Tax=Pleurodeles waltl TaxID=8319 RepID=A0AAV7SSP0_PLEWA|nr:hypothetical protein NDU88_007490 [Pleurodeles waltl]
MVRNKGRPLQQSNKMDKYAVPWQTEGPLVSDSAEGGHGKDQGPPVEPLLNAILTAIQDLRVSLESMLDAATVNVTLLRADLKKVAEKVTTAETDIARLQSASKRLEEQWRRLFDGARISPRPELTRRRKHLSRKTLARSQLETAAVRMPNQLASLIRSEVISSARFTRVAAPAKGARDLRADTDPSAAVPGLWSPAVLWGEEDGRSVRLRAQWCQGRGSARLRAQWCPGRGSASLRAQQCPGRGSARLRAQQWPGRSGARSMEPSDALEG